MEDLKKFINKKRFVMFREIERPIEWDNEEEWEEEDLDEYDLEEFDEDEE